MVYGNIDQKMSMFTSVLVYKLILFIAFALSVIVFHAHTAQGSFMLSEIYLHHQRVQDFINAYLIELDPIAAANAAGRKGEAGKVYAKALMSDKRVQEEIQRRMTDRAARLQINADSVLADINRVKSDAMETYYNEKTGRDEMTSRGDALKALELLGKHLVLFTDKVQVDAAVTVNILSFDESQAQGVTIEATKRHRDAQEAELIEFDTDVANTENIAQNEAQELVRIQEF